MRKIKATALYSLVILNVLTYSCDKVFKEDEINKFTINNASDLRSAIASLNLLFCYVPVNSYKLLANADDISIASLTIIPIDQKCVKLINDADIDPNWQKNAYISCYKTIACANNILKKASGLSSTDSIIKNLLGEVYYLRAYSYFWLVRLFGQVPIIDNTEVNYTVKKGTFAEIYQFIEQDLLKSITMLPSTNNEVRIYSATPHQGTAKALLAEVYLNMGGYPLKNTAMYERAAIVAGEVIANKKSYNFDLMVDFADLWSNINNFRPQKFTKKQESVFSIYGVIWQKSLPTPEGIEKDYLGGYGLGSVPSPGIMFFNNFPESYRKDMTYQNDRYLLYFPPCILDSVTGKKNCPNPDTIPYHVNSMTTCDRNVFKKYFTSKPNLKKDLIDKSNKPDLQLKFLRPDPVFPSQVYLLRYAHTLLTYAEAKARSGNIDISAYEAINQVRRRANKVALNSPSLYDLTPGLSNDQFADSVVNERAWEFCSEPEGRWFELLRLELTKNLKNLIIKGQGTLFPIKIDQTTFFYTIPMEDQELNKNLE